MFGAFWPMLHSISKTVRPVGCTFFAATWFATYQYGIKNFLSRPHELAFPRLCGSFDCMLLLYLALVVLPYIRCCNNIHKEWGFLEKIFTEMLITQTVTVLVNIVVANSGHNAYLQYRLTIIPIQLDANKNKGMLIIVIHQLNHMTNSFFQE